MRRALHAVLVGAVGAGLVHIAIVMRLPEASADDAWLRVERAAAPDRATVAAPFLFAPDPFFRRAACRFDLRQGARRLRAEGSVSAWFLSVHAPDGSVLGGLNDRGVPEGLLDVVVLTSGQRAQAGTAPARLTPIEAEAAEVLAVLEVFVPDATWAAAADAFTESLACDPLAGSQ